MEHNNAYPNMRQTHVSVGDNVPCWHAIEIAYYLWKHDIFGRIVKIRQFAEVTTSFYFLKWYKCTRS